MLIFKNASQMLAFFSWSQNQNLILRKLVPFHFSSHASNTASVVIRKTTISLPVIPKPSDYIEEVACITRDGRVKFAVNGFSERVVMSSRGSYLFHLRYIATPVKSNIQGGHSGNAVISTKSKLLHSFVWGRSKERNLAFFTPAHFALEQINSSLETTFTHFLKPRS